MDNVTASVFWGTLERRMKQKMLEQVPLKQLMYTENGMNNVIPSINMGVLGE
jgi:hypothetical protein